jgi:DNA-binding transcriptional MerR regulator
LYIIFVVLAKKGFIQLSLFDAFADQEQPVPMPEKKAKVVEKEKVPEPVAAPEPIVNNTIQKSTSVILPGNIASNIIDINALKKPLPEKEVPVEPAMPEAAPLPKKLNIVLPKIVEENDVALSKTHLFEEEPLATKKPEIVNYNFEEPAIVMVAEEKPVANVGFTVKKIKATAPEKPVTIKPLVTKATTTKRRGRKSQAEMAQEAKWLNIPTHDVLYSKQYYSIGQVAAMFNANVSKIRFWEEQLSSMLKVRKNRKGDRYFTPDNIKTLEQIYMLTSQRGLTMSGAAQLIENQKNGVHTQEMMLTNLEDLKQFLLYLQASLSV